MIKYQEKKKWTRIFNEQNPIEIYHYHYYFHRMEFLATMMLKNFVVFHEDWLDSKRDYLFHFLVDLMEMIPRRVKILTRKYLLVLLFLNLMTKVLILLLIFVVVQMDFVLVLLKKYLDFEYLLSAMLNHILMTIQVVKMVSKKHLVLKYH